MSIQPWLRDYNYINDYFWTLNQYYEKVYRAYPCNYYSINRTDTVWDDTKLLGGSYEKNGVGELSGVKFNKISMLPVFGIDPIVPNSENGESGSTFKSSLITKILIPSTYGISPLAADCVDLNFGFNADSPKIRPLYLVSGIDVSHHGEYYKFYNLKLTVAPYSLDEIEEQISEYFIFHNSIKKILPLPKSKMLFTLESRFTNINISLDTIYDTSTNLYIKSKEYPGITI